MSAAALPPRHISRCLCRRRRKTKRTCYGNPPSKSRRLSPPPHNKDPPPPSPPSSCAAARSIGATAGALVADRRRARPGRWRGRLSEVLSHLLHHPSAADEHRQRALTRPPLRLFESSSSPAARLFHNHLLSGGLFANMFPKILAEVRGARGDERSSLVNYLPHRLTR